MAIPGYDPSDVHQIALEHRNGVATAVDSASSGTEDGDPGHERARAEIVASEVPESIEIRESDRDAPGGALTEPVELVGLEGVDGLEVIQLTIEYDPSFLPPGASPTDVAVALEVDAGYDRLASDVDLEGTTVTAILPEPPSGETVVAVHEENDEELLGRIE